MIFASPNIARLSVVCYECVMILSLLLGQIEVLYTMFVISVLKMCEYALRLSNGNNETVPIVVRKQLLSTWVNAKYLMQQQIGQNLDIDDEVCGSVFDGINNKC